MTVRGDKNSRRRYAMVRYRPKRWLVVPLWLLCATLALVAHGEDPVRHVEATSAEPIRYRRIFIPNDQPPTSAGTYLPVDAEQFERLVAGPATAEESAAPARLRSVKLQARLDEQGNLLGEMLLDIAHGEGRPALVNLGECNLSITGPAEVSDGQEPPMLGTLGDGHLGVVVDRSLVLHVPWARQGESVETPVRDFRLVVPECGEIELSVDAPRDWRLAIDRGVVVSVEKASSARRVWKFALGGSRRFGLHAQRKREMKDVAPTGVRQRSTYDLSGGGIQLLSEFELDADYEPVDSVAILVSRGLRVVSVEAQGQRVPWRVRDVEDDVAAHFTRMQIDLPEPIVGKGHRLTIRGFATGIPEGEFRLPEIRLTDVFWQQGVSLIRVASPLEIVELSGHDCRQTDVRQVTDPFVGELIELRLFDPAAAIDLAVRERPVRLQLERVDELTLADDVVGMRIASRFSVNQGSVFRLEADVAPDCVVDSVQSSRPDAIEDWYVESAEAGSRLIVRLADAVSSDQPVELIVAARSLTSPLGRALDRDALVSIVWHDVAVSGHLLALRGQAGLEVTPTAREQLPLVERNHLSESQLSLFAASAADMVLDVTRPAEPWTLELGDKHPQYDASIEVTADVDRNRVGERYAMLIEPIDSRVDRLYVHFSSSGTKSLEWSTAGQADEQLSARRLTVAQQAALGLGPAGETWDVRLPQPQDVPFELRARRSATMDRTWEVGLAMVQGARRQSGIVTIEATPATGVRIVADRLRSVPDAQTVPDRSLQIRNTFEYLPARDARGDGESAVVLQRDTDLARHPALVVWGSSSSTRLAPTGELLHRVAYWIESFGAESFTVRLDEADRLRRAEVNHRDVSPRTVGHSYTVALPNDARFTVVTLEVESHQRAPGWWGYVEMPRIETDFDALNVRRMVWLPADYEVVDDHVAEDGAPRSRVWQSRLFGPLANSGSRLTEGHPLTNTGITGSGVTGVPRIDDWIEAMGRAYRGLTADSAPVPSWGQLLMGADRQHYASPTNRLLVDSAALDTLQLGPDVQVPAVVEGDNLTVGAELLMAANLVIIRDAGWNVLTTKPALDRRADGDGIDVGVVGGELGDEPAASKILSATEPPWYLVGVEAWCNQPRSPWQSSARALSEVETGHRWNAVPISGDRNQTSFLVVDRRALAACTGAVFLLTVALGWAVPRISSVSVVVAGLLAASGALIMPAPIAPFATAVFGGCVAALAGRALMSTPNEPVTVDTVEPVGRARTLATVTSLLLVTLLCAISWAGRAAGQARSAADESGHKTQVYRVFIPVDDDQLPTGSRYYVPSDLYDELRRRDAVARMEPSGWMIERAEYQGVLEADEAVGQLRLGSLRASYYLNVFGPETEVALPLPRPMANVRVAEVTVDGVTVTQRDKSDRAVFTVSELGHHVVDVTLLPSEELRQPLDHFEIETPNVARAALVMRMPPGPQRVRIASPAANVTRDEQRGEFRAALGGSDRLDLRWGSRSVAESEISVSELLWLDVRPGGVEIEAMYIPIGGMVGEGELHLACESRLRPLPLDDEAAPPEVSLRNSGATQVVTLGRSSLRDGAFHVLFRQLDAAGVGQIRVPRVEPLWASVDTRWVAVSVDRSLKMTAADGLETITGDEFISRWGDSRRRPDLVCRRPDDGRPLVLTRLPQPRRRVQENVAFRFDLDRVVVDLRSQVETFDGNPFQHHVRLPKQCIVDDVTLMASGEPDERLVRHWTQNQDGDLVVQVAASTPPRFELRVRGEMPVMLGEAFYLPNVGMDGADEGERSVEVYRSHRVRVELGGVQSTVPLEDDETVAAGATRWFGLARFTPSAGDTGATVRVFQNDPVIAAVERTVLERNDGQWRVRIEADLNVQGGVLDEARFRLPQTVVGPFQTSDDVSVRLDDNGPSTTNVLEVRPRQSVTGHWRFMISSPLVFNPGEAVELLPIDLVGADELRQTILLPSRTAPDEISWDPVGLTREAAQRINVLGGGSSIYDVYRVTSPLYSVKMRSQRRAQPQPKVYLAQAHVNWTADAGCRGLATFDVDAGDLQHCTMQLSKGWRVDRITIDGVPATWLATSEGRFRVDLVHAAAPSRIEVFYERDRLQRETDADVVAAPTLLDVPMPDVLWTVSAAGPVDLSVGNGSDADRRDVDLTSLELAIRRYGGLVSVVDGFADSSRQRPPQEVAAAVRPWIARVAAARAEVSRRRGDEFDIVERSAADEEIRRSETRWQSAIERLAADGDPAANDLVHEAGPSDDEAGLWQLSISDQAFRVNAATSAPVQLRVTAMDESTGLAGRAIAAFVCAGLAVVVVRRREWLASARPSLGWLYAAGLVLGLFWWMMLVPRLVGLVIIAWAALSLVFWWREAPPADEQASAALATTGPTSP